MSEQDQKPVESENAASTETGESKATEVPEKDLEQVVGGGVAHHEFQITKLVDASSPKLYEIAATTPAIKTP